MTPPSEVTGATGEVWYELAIDSASTPDDTINQKDVFPSRVQVYSILFPWRVTQADRATTASNALAVAGVAAGDLATDADLTSGLSAKADVSHSHDTLYAAILHNHNGVYALISHSHDLEDLGGALTDAPVPNNITIDHATSASTAGHADTATTASHADMASAATASEHSDTATTASYASAALTASTANHSDTAMTVTAADRATTATHSSRATRAERVKQVVRDFVVASCMVRKLIGRVWGLGIADSAR